MPPQLGKTLIYAGLALVALGLLVLAGDKLPFRLGQLPGDINYRGKNTSVSFPIVTCLLLSAIASLVMWLINRR